MLTDLLSVLPPRWIRRVWTALKTHDGWHNWLEMCPCGVDLQPGEGDL